jgi:hypothetical protein
VKIKKVKLLDGGKLLMSNPESFTPGETAFGVRLIGGWRFPKSRSGRFVEGSNVLPLVEIEIFMVRVGRGAQIPGASSHWRLYFCA